MRGLFSAFSLMLTRLRLLIRISVLSSLLSSGAEFSLSILFLPLFPFRSGSLCDLFCVALCLIIPCAVCELSVSLVPWHFLPFRHFLSSSLHYKL